VVVVAAQAIIDVNTGCCTSKRQLDSSRIVSLDRILKLERALAERVQRHRSLIPLSQQP
jgi:hypothetical protein